MTASIARSTAARSESRLRLSAKRPLLFAGAVFACVLVLGVSVVAAAEPVLTVDPTPTAAYTTAEVSGMVNPEDQEVFYFFQYSKDPDAEGWASGPEAFTRTLPAGSGATPVTESLVGLQPGAEYKVRLVAVPGDFSAEYVTSAPYPTFTTKPVTAPTVSLDPITTKTDTTAHLTGHVNPNSPGGLDQAGKAAYLTTWQFHCNPGCPNGLETHEVEAEDGNTAVSADVSGLEPNTPYEVTLTASNAGGEGTDAAQTFSTDEIVATVHVGPGSSVGSGNYQLEGTVNPRNSAITDCRFEYGTDTSYGKTVPCDQTPATANKAAFVTASLSGLQVGDEYHFRLSATNGAGPASSGDAVFTPTQACPNEAIREEQRSTYLPECRAYEQVSNPFKEAFPVGGSLVSPDGNRFVYTSSGNFAENSLGYSANSYLARRGVTGWTTEALNPPAPPFALSLVPRIAFAADLRSSLWTMSRSDQTLDEQEFYRRDATGAFERIGPIFGPDELPPSAPGSTPLGRFINFGVSNADDRSRIVFSTAATNQRNKPLLEYDGVGQSSPRAVDVDNLGDTIGANCLESPGGAQRDLGRRSMSSDGRVFFWTADCSQSKRLFARLGHTVTVAVSASECDRAGSDPAGPCLDSPLSAEFQSAADDGSVVYFTSPNQLVDGDADEAEDLYACDVPAGHPAPTGAFNSCSSLTEVSAAPGADFQGVAAVSGDGSHVYFVARGTLASNAGTDGETAQVGDYNLYLWQRDASHPQGLTTFVVKMDPSDGALWNPAPQVPTQVTRSGQVLILQAGTPLVDAGPQADTDGGAGDIYRYDAGAKEMNRVSVDSSGDGGNQPGVGADFIHEGGSESAFTFPPAMSENGGRVVFSTSEALSPFDHNQTVDTYLWAKGRVSLISSGDSAAADLFSFPVINPSGTDVFFATVISLAATDTDTGIDVYDVHVDGGFPPPEAPDRCLGEAGCRSPAGMPPAVTDSPTRAAGSGNPRQAKRCPKHKARRKGRCVKRQSKSGNHGKHRHTARHQGGAK